MKELPTTGREPKLTEDDLDTIETIARNDQTGRITPWEIRELLLGYRAYLAALSLAGEKP